MTLTVTSTPWTKVLRRDLTLQALFTSIKTGARVKIIAIFILSVEMTWF
jgi:hypothetical protein